jgi:flagellin
MVNPISNSTGLSALFSLNRNLAELNTTMTRLATARRINSGSDDPAGLITVEQLSSEIAALETQQQSYERAYSKATIADGSSAQLSTLYGDLNSLVVQGANTAGMSDAERDAIQMQIDTTVAGIQRLTGDAVTSLDGISLPDGGNVDAAASLTAASVAAASLVSGGANSLASGNYDAAQTAITGAIGGVATVRGTIGAYQSDTLQTALDSGAVAIENLYAARSRIQDTDYAEEFSRLAMYQTLSEASFQMVNTTQKLSGSVLDLFR